MNKTRNQSGVSLVDLIIGVALLVIITLGAALSLKSLGEGRGGMSLNARVNNKLRTIAEQMRYDAATNEYYLWDQTPTKDWTNSFDPAITVTSTVEAENAATRSRKITLSASWYDITGGAKSKTMTFFANRVRAWTAGAAVRLRVVKTVDPTEGIEGVKVWVKGENGMIPPLGALTDGDGRVSIAGALIGANIPVTVNGEDAKAFFASGPSWSKGYPDLKLTQTSLSMENREYDDGGTPGPIQMVAPGSIAGKVYDLSTDAPNVGAPAGLYVKVFLESSDIGWSPAEVNLSTYTVAGGTFRIDKLVPGTYFPAMLGNNSYAAHARPNDNMNVVNNPDFVRIDSDELEIRDFRTGRRGSLSGSVTKVIFNSGSFTTNGPAPSAVKLSFYRRNTVGYHDPTVAFPTTLSFGNSTAWLKYWHSILNADTYSTVGANSDYTLTEFTPVLVHQDTTTYNMSDQYNIVRIEPDAEMVSPLTPIRVLDIGGYPSTPANTRFLLTSSRSSLRLIAPATELTDPFSDVQVKVNSSQTKAIYLLDRSALARVSGQIYLDDDANGDDGDDPVFLGAPGVVTIPFGPKAPPRGFGGVFFEGNNANRAVIRPYSFNSNRNTGTGTHTFDSVYGLMANNLPPNIGTDTTLLKFIGSDPATPNRTFTGDVTAVMKVVDDNDDLRFVSVDPALIDAQINLSGWVYVPNGANRGTTNGRVFTQGSLVIEDGRLGPGGGGFVQQVQVRNEWRGETQVALAPGVETPNVRISVSPTQVNHHEQYVLQFEGLSVDKQWMRNGGWPNPGGPVYGCYNNLTYTLDANYGWNTRKLDLAHRIKGRIFGIVRAAGTNLPIQGAVVAFADRDGRSHPTITTGADGRYDYDTDSDGDPLYFSPYTNWTVATRVASAPTVGSTNYAATGWYYKEMFDMGTGTYEWNLNFTLVGTPVNTGGGGPTGGQGN